MNFARKNKIKNFSAAFRHEKSRFSRRRPRPLFLRSRRRALLVGITRSTRAPRGESSRGDDVVRRPRAPSQTTSGFRGFFPPTTAGARDPVRAGFSAKTTHTTVRGRVDDRRAV